MRRKGLVGAAWIGLVMVLEACGAKQELDDQRLRIDTLEREVRRLDDSLGAMKQTLEASKKPPAAAAAPDRIYTVLCPRPWKELGKLGDTSWVCRAELPQRDGSWPMCTVTAWPLVEEWELKDYFFAAMNAGPQNRGLRNFQEVPIVIHNWTGFEVRYEHQPSAAPVKVLAAVLTYDDDSYVINCSAASDGFAGVEATFKQIIESFEFKKK
jgi:hypothetical protein